MKKLRNLLKGSSFAILAMMVLVLGYGCLSDKTTNNLDQPPKVDSVKTDIKITDVEAPKPTTPQARFIHNIIQEVDTAGHTQTTVKHRGTTYDIFVADLRKVNLNIHWKKSDGTLYQTLDALKRDLEGQGQRCLFATNGGIFAPGQSPEGLYVENRQLLKPLNLKKGRGNFYLKPNGVFVVASNQSATIVKSEAYPQLVSTLKSENLDVLYAVQSGPMLRIQGIKHPKFNEGSPNTHFRNGVGIFNNNSKRVVFAISRKEVNLFDFSSLFFDKLQCDDALYLDGFISRMYIAGSKRQDLDGNFATMISATAK